MAYTVRQAKDHFSRLLKEAEAGKEVIIMRGAKPIAKLVPIEAPVLKSPRLGGFEFLPPVDDRAFDPLTDEQMIEYGFENPEKDARLAAILGGKGMRTSDSDKRPFDLSGVHQIYL